jgi:tetratricopeptide (TPR) repeat protein
MLDKGLRGTPRSKVHAAKIASGVTSRRQWQRIPISLAVIVLLGAVEVAGVNGQPSFGKQQPTSASSLSSRDLSSSSHPLSAKANRARKLLEQGQNGEAISLLRQAIKENDRDGDAHLLLGIALSAVPKRSEALQELHQAIALQPHSAVAWFSLGNAQARFADLALAQKAYETAVHLDPDFVQARIALALVLAQLKQFSAASENLASVLSKLGEGPSAAYPHYLLGRVLLEQNHPHQALKELGAAVRLRPHYEEAHFTAGLAYMSLHDDRAAADALEKAVQLSPGDAEAEYQLGGALLRLGDAEHAIKPLQLTVEMRPDDRQARWQLCQSFRKASRKADAMNCQQQLGVLISRENAAMQDTAATQHNNQGVMLEKAGNLKAAVVNYQAAVTLNPSQPVFRRNLALALCREGHWQQGIAELRKVLQESPGDTEATKALYIALDHVKEEPVSAPTSANNSKPVPSQSER